MNFCDMQSAARGGGELPTWLGHVENIFAEQEIKTIKNVFRTIRENIVG